MLVDDGQVIAGHHVHVDLGDQATPDRRRRAGGPRLLLRPEQHDPARRPAREVAHDNAVIHGHEIGALRVRRRRQPEQSARTSRDEGRAARVAAARRAPRPASGAAPAARRNGAGGGPVSAAGGRAPAEARQRLTGAEAISATRSTRSPPRAGGGRSRTPRARRCSTQPDDRPARLQRAHDVELRGGHRFHGGRHGRPGPGEGRTACTGWRGPSRRARRRA